MPVIANNLSRITDVQVRITRSYNQCFLHIDIPKDKEHCAIYYTLDGSTPHRASSRYTNPVALDLGIQRIMVYLAGPGGGLYQYDANTRCTIMVSSAHDTALPEPPIQTPSPAASPKPAAQPAATPTATQGHTERKPRNGVIIFAYLFAFVCIGAGVCMELEIPSFRILKFIYIPVVFGIFHIIKKMA